MKKRDPLGTLSGNEQRFTPTSIFHDTCSTNKPPAFTKKPATEKSIEIRGSLRRPSDERILLGCVKLLNVQLKQCRKENALLKWKLQALQVSKTDEEIQQSLSPKSVVTPKKRRMSGSEMSPCSTGKVDIESPAARLNSSMKTPQRLSKRELQSPLSPAKSNSQGRDALSKENFCPDVCATSPLKQSFDAGCKPKSTTSSMPKPLSGNLHRNIPDSTSKLEQRLSSLEECFRLLSVNSRKELDQNGQAHLLQRPEQPPYPRTTARESPTSVAAAAVQSPCDQSQVKGAAVGIDILDSGNSENDDQSSCSAAATAGATPPPSTVPKGLVAGCSVCRDHGLSPSSIPIDMEFQAFHEAVFDATALSRRLLLRNIQPTAEARDCAVGSGGSLVGTYKSLSTTVDIRTGERDLPVQRDMVSELGHQGGKGPKVPLTDLPALQSKLSTWRERYGPSPTTSQSKP